MSIKPRAALHIAVLGLIGCVAAGEDASVQAESMGASAVPPGGPMLSASGHDTCVLARRGIRCWGYSGTQSETMPSLVHPRQVALGFDFTCALDDEGAKCWGYNSSGQATPPRTLRHPRQITAGWVHACAL